MERGTHTRTYIILGIVLIVGVVFGAAFLHTWYFVPVKSVVVNDQSVGGVPENDKTVEVDLACSNDYAIHATYSTPDERGVMQKLALSVIHGEVATLYEMLPALSGSGSRFETEDGTVVLWEHQDEFRFMMDGADVALCRKANPVEVSEDPAGTVTEGGLTGKTWTFVDATTREGGVFQPKSAGVFTLRFEENGVVAVGTDCNNASGVYSVSGDALVMKDMATTLMYCEGSEESSFLSLLSFVERYSLEGGTLRLMLNGGLGEMRFN